MNPPRPPYPTQSFSTFVNPNSFPSLPPPPPTSSHHPPPPPPPSLSTTLSSLDHLITLSTQTLHSLSSLLPKRSAADLVPCPFNPQHRIPPESLFTHHLKCPSPVDLGSSLDSLNYPNTLSSSAISENRFKDEAVRDPSGSELCFALDGFGNFRSNFFYENCPGVVTFPIEDGARDRTFTLPRILSVECANFVAVDDLGTENTQKSCSGIWPSELWNVRSEVEAWIDHPNVYSYDVLCVILGVGVVNEHDLRRWIIAGSPQMGVDIDVAMRDHIFLLFSLCLKAIFREGVSLMKTRDLMGNTGNFNEFKCPNLVQVMMWLASQLSVLYGQVNGKFFAIYLLKKCILDAALHLLVDCSAQRVNESTDKEDCEQELDASGGSQVKVKKQLDMEENGVDNILTENINKKVIFVSQVAAAVAALHERALLEEKIKALRQSFLPSRYQRMTEHNDMIKRADAEREKRPDYKPVIDHDGLPRLQSANQETGKVKTREELLAEERDYKRRRMSYRGKKAKRNTIQVMRDIIEEYMEEIKQAGGIGCFEKSADGIYSTEVPSSGAFPEKDTFELPTIQESYPAHSQRETRTDQERTSFSNVIHDSYSGGGKSRGRQSDKYNTEINVGNNHDRHYHSHCPERTYRRHSQERHSRWTEREDVASTRRKQQELERSSSVRSNYSKSRSSYYRTDSDGDEWNRKSRDRKQLKTHRRHDSDLLERGFEDRYDPSKSSDRCEE